MIQQVSDALLNPRVDVVIRENPEKVLHFLAVRITKEDVHLQVKRMLDK